MNIDDYADKMLTAYIECALWSSYDSNEEDMNEPLDANYDADDLFGETRLEMEQDVYDFVRSNTADLEGMDPGQAGHDFWLTRNRHGVGFWDRGLGALGDRLTEASHPYGEVSLYVGDDGQIYAM